MAFTAQALVGSSFVAAVTLHDYPVAAGQAGRYALAAIVLLALTGFRFPRLTRPDILPLLGLTITGLALFNALMIVGVEASDPAAVGVIVGCVPVFLALLGPLQRGARPLPRVVGAGVVVAVGAALVQWTGEGLSTVGFLCALGALACEAAFTLLAVPLLPRLGPLGITQWATTLVVPMLVVWALVVDGPGAQRLPHPDEALALLWLTAAVTAVAFLCWYGAVQRIGPERAGLFSGVLPISAAALGAMTGSVELTPIRVAGAVAVAAGVTLGMLAARRPGAGTAATGTVPP